MMNALPKAPQDVHVNIPRARRVTQSDIELEIKRCPVMHQSHSTKGLLESIVKRYCCDVNELRPHVELFAGLSGTGKTETYLWLVNLLFNPTNIEEKSLILRVHPCTVVSDEHDVAQLVGTPMGTIGRGYSTGTLIDFASKLQEKETDPSVYISGVFVFEDVDRVSYDQFMVKLMGIFESGVVQSARTGTIYSVRKVIFIMTGNGIGVKKLKRENQRKNAVDIAGLEKAVRDEVQHKMCNGHNYTVARFGNIRSYLPFNDKEEKKYISCTLSRFMQSTFRNRTGAGKFVANNRTVSIEPELVTFIQRFWDPKTNCRSLRDVTSILRSDIADSYDVCPVVPFRIEFDEHTNQVSLRDSSDGPTITFEAPRPPSIRVVESDDEGSDDEEKKNWQTLTTNVVEETVRQNGKSINRVSRSLYKSIPAVARVESWTRAMECIMSAAKEVCSYLPDGEAGKAMDLIRHPVEPNSWVLALAADRKRVHFVINLNPHFTNELTVSQVAQSKPPPRCQACEYKHEMSRLLTKQATDMSEMRTLAATSINGKLSCNEPTSLISGEKKKIDQERVRKRKR
jgi:hypothetical protein